MWQINSTTYQQIYKINKLIRLLIFFKKTDSDTVVFFQTTSLQREAVLEVLCTAKNATNVGRYKRRTVQTSDSTNVGQYKRWTVKTTDQDKRRTSTSVGLGQRRTEQTSNQYKRQTKRSRTKKSHHTRISSKTRISLQHRISHQSKRFDPQGSDQ